MNDTPKYRYEEIVKSEAYSSWASFYSKKISIRLFCAIQDLPLTPSLITLFSLALAAAAVLSLLSLGSKILFILFSVLTIIFDQLDGIWARAKRQESKFGRFFDGFIDAVKFFIVDLGLMIFAFDQLLVFFGGPLALTAFVAAYFALKNFYGESAVGNRSSSVQEGVRTIGLTGSAARYLFIFPMVVLVDGLPTLYFLASFAMYVFSVSGFLAMRYRAAASVPGAKGRD